MRIVMAGASGLLGTALGDRFRADGHDVVQLVRRPTQAPDESTWDPHAGEIDHAVIEAADVVVNTAGTSLLANPHSKKWARKMRDSRVNTTATLSRAIATVGGGPAFMAGNGSSIYGDHGSEPVTEDSDSRGDALLTRIAREWQAATEPAAEAGSRVCVLRTSPVANRTNPLYRVQIPLCRCYLGTRLSSGRQYFPLMSLRDWVGAVAHLTAHPDASGPFNMCCPVTPTNAEYTDALAAAVGRKAFLAVPAPVLRLAAGPMAPETLNSINLQPAALEAAGYDFQDRDVRDVLAAMLNA
ncbi:MAG TPA: DUF1731 domain-containing protein [Nocardioides sp.]|nr:DUF1731 domain-containing protein [Nocardioides sp.]